MVYILETNMAVVSRISLPLANNPTDKSSNAVEAKDDIKAFKIVRSPLLMILHLILRV